MRLFVAIDLDDEAKRAIVEEQHRLASSLEREGFSRSGRSPKGFALQTASPKWVQPDHMHLTLVFLGEVPEARAPSVVDTFARPLVGRSFSLALGGIGVFPPHGAPKVVWMGLPEGADELRPLHRQVASRIEDLGIPLESGPFRPHLTLGRWRNSRPSYRRKILAGQSERVIARVPVDGVTLYMSRLSSAGSTYTVLARATLSPARC